MFDIQNEVLEWGGKKLTIETGRVADNHMVRFSNIAEHRFWQQFFTQKRKERFRLLSFDSKLSRKSLCNGKILVVFLRGGRPSEKETLVSRLIDEL